MAKNIRERAKKRSEETVKRAEATAKYVRSTPSKVARVLDLIRNKSYADARAILEAIPHLIARDILKLLNSAASNGENNLSLNRDDLFVKECFANPGPTYKRMMPRAKGRGVRILKRTSHITIVLDTVK